MLSLLHKGKSVTIQIHGLSHLTTLYQCIILSSPSEASMAALNSYIRTSGDVSQSVSNELLAA